MKVLEVLFCLAVLCALLVMGASVVGFILRLPESESKPNTTTSRYVQYKRYICKNHYEYLMVDSETGASYRRCSREGGVEGPSVKLPSHRAACVCEMPESSTIGRTCE